MNKQLPLTGKQHYTIRENGRQLLLVVATTSANRETRQFARFVSQVSESLGFAGFRLEYHVKLVSLATRSIR
jgi:hypothetical protein